MLKYTQARTAMAQTQSTVRMAIFTCKNAMIARISHTLDLIHYYFHTRSVTMILPLGNLTANV